MCGAFLLGELEARPDPDYLIPGLLPERSLGYLYGQPKSFKSFLTLDMSACIATGSTFFGRTARKGRVIYVLGEGGGGFPRRLAAYRRYRQLGDQVDGQQFREGGLPLINNANVGAFIRTAAELEPDLIVLDTLSRCLVGAEENSSGDMGTAVAALERIRSELDIAVLAVHHSTKSDGRSERGHSVLRGAIDVAINVQTTKQTIEVACRDMKDDVGFDAFVLRPQVVDLSDLGRRDSIVLVPAEATGDTDVDTELAAALALVSNESVTHTDLVSTLMQRLECSRSTAMRRVKALVEEEMIEKIGNGRGKLYRPADRP